MKETKEIYKEQNKLIKALFENGFLHADMILRVLFEQTSKKNLDSVPPDKKTVKILNIREITESLKTKRKYIYKFFEIWAVTRLDDDGWGAFPVFYLLLENEDAEKNSSFSDFVKGAKIKCFQYGYLQL